MSDTAESSCPSQTSAFPASSDSDAGGCRVLAVVLTCSAPEHVRRCIASLSGQKRRPDGVLVIDNCGDPPVTADLFDTTLPVVILRTGKNVGPAGGFATAIDVFLGSGYDFVWLMDDDISPHPVCLETLVVAVGDTEAIAVPFLAADPHHDERRHSWGWWAVLIPRRVAQRHGGPRAEFVWWLEDTEYMQRRLPSEGVTVVRPAGAVVHRANRRSDRYRPAWKYFYEARNATYVHFHLEQRRYLRHLARELTATARWILRAEEHRGRKLSALARGFVAGVNGSLGLTVPLENPHRPDDQA